MQKKRIIIYSNRFLIVKGLVCIIREEFGIEPDIFANRQEFVFFTKSVDKALIIWDKNLLDKELLEQIDNNNFLILSIGNVFNDLRKYIVDFIHLRAEYSFIISKLRCYLEQLFLSIKREETDKADLTEREKQIVRYIAMGKTNQQIAQELSISPHTVITHRKNITSKLGIKTISGLTIYALLNGIVKIEEIEKSIK